MVDPLAVLRRSVFRLGLLTAILALTLLVPVIPVFGLIPARVRQRAGRRLAARLQAVAPLARLGARRIEAETGAAPISSFPVRHRAI